TGSSASAAAVAPTAPPRPASPPPRPPTSATAPTGAARSPRGRTRDKQASCAHLELTSTRSRGGPELRECLAVEGNPEARRAGDRDLAVDDRELLGQQLAGQGRLGQFGGQELDVRAAGAGGGQVGAGGDADAGLPAVRDDQTAALGGDPADLAGLGEAADAADIRLEDVDEA